MIFLKKIIPFLTATLTAGLLELSVWLKPLFFIGVGLSLLMTLASYLYLIRGKASRHETFYLLITPLTFFISSTSFLLFTETVLIQQLMIAVVVIFYFILTNNIFTYFYEPNRYRAYSMEQLVAFLNVATVFFATTVFFFIIIFFTFPRWPFVLAIFFLTFLLTYQMHWIHKVRFMVGVPFVLLSSLLTVELFWIVSLLPSSPLVNGFLVTVAYYLITSIARQHLTIGLKERTTRNFVVISLVVVILIVATAQWYY